MAVRLLAVDAGTSSVRAVMVDGDGRVVGEARRVTPPSTPAPGLVELDAEALVGAAVAAADEVVAAHGPADAVGITNQRGTAVVWEPATGRPLGPALGWQDLRTQARCEELLGAGHLIVANHAATKFEWLWDLVDPDRRRDLLVGTVDTWLAWNLTGGAVHVTDPSNAVVSGLLSLTDEGWDAGLLDLLRLDAAALPTVVDSGGELAPAVRLAGGPPLVALMGDQSASLLGQGCVGDGDTKITFGTGATLDRCTGSVSVDAGLSGCFPARMWSVAGEPTWGLEAMVFTAGACVDWLVDLGVVGTAAESAEVAGACDDTGGVVFVPALSGLGTPHWDHTARGTLLGATRGTGRAEVVRAVLEGVAHRGADLVDAVEGVTGDRPSVLHVDGGMSANPVFVQAVADACGVPVALAARVEATALGVARLAGVVVGHWSSVPEAAATGDGPRGVVEPAWRLDRDRWSEAVARSRP